MREMVQDRVLHHFSEKCNILEKDFFEKKLEIYLPGIQM